MFNPREHYIEIGVRAAKARNVGDEALAKFEARYFRECRAFETGDDRHVATELYLEGYRSARKHHVATELYREGYRSARKQSNF